MDAKNKLEIIKNHPLRYWFIAIPVFIIIIFIYSIDIWQKMSFVNDKIKNEEEFIDSNLVKSSKDSKIYSNDKIKEPKERKNYVISKTSYTDDNGNIFYATFTEERGSIKKICCRNTGKSVNWTGIFNSPVYIVTNDTSEVIEKAIRWLKNNNQNEYDNLMNR